MATSEVITLPRVRLSFAKLFEPRNFTEGQPKRYEATFLLDPSNKAHAATIKEIKKAAMKLIVETYKDGKKPPGLKYCWGDGNSKTNKDDEVYEGYSDMWFISANKKEDTGRVTVVDGNKNPVNGPGDPGAPFSGCYVHGSITLWSQQNQFGNRINANLRAVMFAADGDAFSAARPVDVEKEFEDFGDDFDEPSGEESNDPLFDDGIPF